ncbi:MAG TPA: response regulator [Candidatus Saccharimonadales bacterium]|nr:response regulator [Candidatus Saccharimonadales bacterium]
MPKQPPTIMVVEDEPVLLEAIAKKLRLSHMGSLTFTSGHEALSHLKNSRRLPDAIWLDYYLKDMDGLAFLQEVHRVKAWHAIPVVVVSNSASPDMVQRMLELGAKRYLLKAEHRLDEIIKIVSDTAHIDESASHQISKE